MARKRVYVEYGIRKVEGVGYEVRIGGKSRTVKTLTEARSMRRQLEQEFAESFGQGTSKMTLGTYLRSWLQQIKATRSSGTLRTWEAVVRLRILPKPIARLKLSGLTPAHIQDWALSLLVMDVSARTVHKYVECLSAALHDAYDKGVVARDLMRGVELPKWEPHQAIVYTPDQMRLYMAACANDFPTNPGPYGLDRPSRTSYALRLIAWSGCRISEARDALEGDIDLERRLWRIPKGKTRAAARVVPLRPEAVAMLTELVDQHRQDAKDWDAVQRFGTRWLFRNWDGKQLSNQGIREGHYRILSKAGLPFCWVHDLRHAFATHALEAHQDRRVVGKILGHANEAMTGFYESVSTSVTGAVVDAVASYRDERKGHICPTCQGTGWISDGQTKQDAG